jgi:hypothetical protein
MAHTGDLRNFDADGFLYMRGANKAMIITGGQMFLTKWVNTGGYDMRQILMEAGCRWARNVGWPRVVWVSV